MKEKTFRLVTGISTGATTIVAAVLSFIQPPYAPAWVSAVGLLNGLIIEVCTLFKTK